MAVAGTGLGTGSSRPLETGCYDAACLRWAGWTAAAAAAAVVVGIEIRRKGIERRR